MSKSIEDCTQDLENINSSMRELRLELEILALERDYVLAVRELLGRDFVETVSDQPIVMYPLYAEIIAIIRDNPGLNGMAVRENLVTDMEPRQLTDTLRAMREKGYIENRGGQGRSGSWYVKTIEERASNGKSQSAD